MKRIRSLVSFIFLCLFLNACKKSKSEAPLPDPIAAYEFNNGSLKNRMSSLLNGTAVGPIPTIADSFDTPKSAITIDRPLVITTGDLNIGGYEETFPVTAVEGRLDNVRI
jgi:hypothetical protein